MGTHLPSTLDVTYCVDLLADTPVKQVASSQLDKAPQVHLENGQQLEASKGVVVATDQPAAQHLLGSLLEASPSTAGEGVGTVNL